MRAADLVTVLLEDAADDINDPKRDILNLQTDDESKGITRRGSQIRQKIGFTEYEVIAALPDGGVILRDGPTGIREFWTQNDDHSGYTIEINGIGYEYVSSSGV